MANPNRMPCKGGDKNFGKEGGITNGAKWYSIQGGNILNHSFFIKQTYIFFLNK